MPSYTTLLLKRWFRNKYSKVGKEKFHFKTRELMADIDELDYENFNDRSTVNNFISRERYNFKQAITSFLQTERYVQEKEAGKGEKELFDALITAALSRDIYPVWCDTDDDYTYYFFNFEDFVEFRKARLQAVETQLKGEKELYDSMEKAIPRIGDHIRPANLEVRPAGLLPEPTVETCPICDKKYRGRSPADLLLAHIKNKHAHPDEEEASIDSFPCPICGALARDRLYKEMRGGDFKCRACKNIQPEEEIRGSGS